MTVCGHPFCKESIYQCQILFPLQAVSQGAREGGRAPVIMSSQSLFRGAESFCFYPPHSGEIECCGEKTLLFHSYEKQFFFQRISVITFSKKFRPASVFKGSDALEGLKSKHDTSLLALKLMREG